MPGASNNGGEDSPGGVVDGEPGLAHPGAIVHNQRGNLVVTHLVAVVELVCLIKQKEKGVA